MSAEKLPNKELKGNASEDVLSMSKVLYEGEAGLIVEVGSAEARDFWSNGNQVDVFSQGRECQ